MREIKFRAWDKKTNKLADVLCIDWLNNTVDLTFGQVEREFSEVKLMQCTGLEDVNGVDVYEGDIVECSSGCPHVVEFVLNHGGNTLGGMPTFYLSGLMNGYQWLDTERVIGNLYENPELLKGE